MDKITEIEIKGREIAELFYQGKDTEGYQAMDGFLGSLLEVLPYLEPELSQQMSLVLTAALQAMEAKDGVLLADLIKYEILGEMLLPAGEEGVSDGETDFFEANMEILQQYDEDAWAKYKEWKPEKRELTVYEETAENGGNVLWVEKEGKKYRLNSSYCPEAEMEERCKQYSFHNLEQVVTVFGCGNGIFAEKLKEAAEPDMRLIIYEPSLEIFDYLMHHTPFAEILIKQNTIVLIQGLNEDKFYGAMDTLLNDNNVNSFQYIVHPGYDRMFPIEYQKYNIEASNGWLRAESNRVTGGYLGKESIYNIVESLPYLKEAQFLEQYVGKFGADIPAVIVAAGPSLDINIETLKKAEGKAVIFAADAAVPRLAEHGIKMDFIVTIDPKKWPGHLAAEACKEVPLICKASANRVIIENHRGKKIFFDMEEYIAALRPEKAGKAKYCGSGGSVATSAFAISVALAFKTVILVGNDLAYRDGCSHAGGVLRREEANAGYRITVESIKGDKIETRYEWYRFLNWFEDIIAHVKEDVKVIDATEGGAKIHGTEIMTLSEAVEQYCTGEIDCRKVTEEIESPYTEDSYKEALEYVEKSLRDLDKIIEESKKTMQKTERLITLCKREQKGKEYQKLEKELFHLGEKIEERPVYGLINEWISKDTENESASMYELDRKEEEMYGDFLQIYKSIHEAAKEIKPILKEAYEKMQA